MAIRIILESEGKKLLMASLKWTIMAAEKSPKVAEKNPHLNNVDFSTFPPL
jgi:hypothetical protein